MVTQPGLPRTIILTRLDHVPPVFWNWTLSRITKTSAKAILLKYPSHGKKFGWWIATSLDAGMLLPKDPHHDDVDALSVDVRSLPQDTFSRESGFLVDADRRHIGRKDLHEHALQIQI